VVRPERFELPTPCFVGKCSIQLSYGRAFAQFHHGWMRVCNATHRKIILNSALLFNRCQCGSFLELEDTSYLVGLRDLKKR
jgi:hypothetical protein